MRWVALMVFGPRRRPCSSTGPKPRLFSELVARSTSRPELRRSKYMLAGLLIVRVGQSSSAGSSRQGFASFTVALDTGWAPTAARASASVVVVRAARMFATLDGVPGKAQDLTCLFDAGHGAPQLLGQADHPGHEVGVARQPLRLVEEVVLESRAHVAAGDQAVGVERE